MGVVVICAEDEGRDMAARFRRDHRLGTQPLGDLVAVIEQTTRIDVAVVDSAEDEHGISLKDPGRTGYYIGVARTTNPMRQRSTLAHELAHVLFEEGWENSGTGWDSRRPEEVRADAFARHLLVPQEGLKEFLGTPTSVTESTLSSVVQRFLVSPAIAAITLEQAGYIDVQTKKDWMGLSTPRLAFRFGWMDQYQTLQSDSDRERTPQRLLARAVRGYEERIVSVQTIANLRSLPLATVEKELREIGITPREDRPTWSDATALPDVHVKLDELDADLGDLWGNEAGSGE